MTAVRTSAGDRDARQPIGRAGSTPASRADGDDGEAGTRLASPRLARLRRDVRAAGGSVSATTREGARFETPLPAVHAVLDAFWTEIAKAGTPLIEPIDTRRSRVTFLWRGADTHNVRLFWPVFPERPDDDALARLDGTDVWFKTMTVPAETRLSYQLAANLPAGERSREQRRQALRAVAQPDPLNPRRWPDGTNAERADVSSVLELPDAPAQPWNHAPSAEAAPSVTTHRVASKILGNERDVTVIVARAGPARRTSPATLLIVFDREPHLERAHTPDLLANLVAAGRLAPIVAVLVGHPTPESRATELPPNPAFATFLATELVPWVRARYPVSDDPRRAIVAGASYGGIAAAYAALEHPDVFGNVLSQSGSFWWAPAREGVWNAAPDACAPPNWLAAEFARRPRVPVRFYLNAGLFEQHSDILPMTRHMRDVLVARGYDVTYHEFAGGHDWLVWRAELATGLLSLAGER